MSSSVGSGSIPRNPGAPIPILEEIPFPGHADARSWRDYPREVLGKEGHPARNRPEMIRWLISHYIENNREQSVWDPMAGVGTTMKEASDFGIQATGWDIEPRWREFWRDGWAEVRPAPGSKDLIITSPPFFRTNHHQGKTKAQDEYREKMQSNAGGSWESDDPEHLGNFKKKRKYWAALAKIYRRCMEILKPGGRLIVIQRDKIKNLKPVPLSRVTVSLFELLGLEVQGRHPRTLWKSGIHRQREADAGREFPYIDVEWAIVGAKR